MSGFVVWLTGLSGAGKSTLASLLTQALAEQGLHVECLDGDEVRKNLSHGLGFAREDRDRNVRRIGYVARMVARSGACAITAAISPYKALRDEIRSKTENFVEVYCECPLDVLTERDPKGLYKRALAGEIKNFTGVDDPYEEPQSPEVHLRTDSTTPEDCIREIVRYLEGRGLLRSNLPGLSQLPPPFGGEVFEARELSADDQALDSVEVSPELCAEIEFVGAGFVSPLSGFMTEREATKVTRGSALERGTPWWDRAFLLPLSVEDCERLNLQDAEAGGISVILRTAGHSIARVTVEEIWKDGDQTYGAGPLDAVARAPLTARALRRKTIESGGAHAAGLFCLAPPDEASLTALRGALSVVDHLVLLVSKRHAAAWTAATQGWDKLSQVDVPDAVPLESPRARAVISKSIGLAKFAELGS